MEGWNLSGKQNIIGKNNPNSSCRKRTPQARKSAVLTQFIHSGIECLILCSACSIHIEIPLSPFFLTGTSLHIRFTYAFRSILAKFRDNGWVSATFSPKQIIVSKVLKSDLTVPFPRLNKPFNPFTNLAILLNRFRQTGGFPSFMIHPP